MIIISRREASINYILAPCLLLPGPTYVCIVLANASSSWLGMIFCCCFFVLENKSDALPGNERNKWCMVTVLLGKGHTSGTGEGITLPCDWRC